jgi:hypothetical protein
MAAIAGITTKKNQQGKLTHVTVDVRKHKQVIPMFEEIGLIEKTDFQKRCENGITVEEARQHSLNHIRSIWKKLL